MPFSPVIDRHQLLNRFLRYVKIDTTADPSSVNYPSSAGQWELGKVLLEELLTLGIQVAHQDKHAIVHGLLPGNVPNAPVVAFNSHLDTSPEARGGGVNPQVIDSYSGGDIALPAKPSLVIRTDENPELEGLVGKTLITTDGTTLLGADDKAGIAIMMQMLTTLVAHPEIPRGDVRVLFTCDEEIGRGVTHVDVPSLGATVCYTFDGPAENQIDVETFSADLACVTFHGVNIHPSMAKGRMVNALRATAALIQQLPPTLTPEMTSDREGFLHPYRIEGGVDQVELKVLLRDFETCQLIEQAELLRKIAREVERQFPPCRIDVRVTSQYRNLAEGLAAEPRAVSFAELAHQRLGRPYRLSSIRGGTDGSQLTALGLPTPNLSSGQHNPHSPLEFACLEEMVQAIEVGVEIVRIWSEPT